MAALPLLFTAALLALTALPRLQVTPILTYAFWGAGAFLALWTGWLVLARPARPRRIVVVKPRPQHYIQTFCHSCVFAYWGYYWPPVYDYFPLLVGQLLFAYAFDILLAWSQGKEYQLGWGPFPIVFSTNLFLWFKDDVVLLAVPPDCRRVCRQGVRALEPRRQAGAHLQPLGLHARDLFVGAARHRHHVDDLGTGDRIDV